MRKSLSRQPYMGNPSVRDDNGGFEKRVLSNKNARSKSIQISVQGMVGNHRSYCDQLNWLEEGRIQGKYQPK